MKLLTSLVAVAGSASVLAPLAIAQSGPVRPQYYSWEKYPLIQDDPEEPDFYVHDDRFMSMIRIELGADDNDSRPYTPDEAAAATVAELVVRLSEPTGATITNDRVAITIQNLGGHVPTVHKNSAFSFLRFDDRIAVTGLNDGNPLEYELYQPWMGYAVGKYVVNQQTQQLEWRTGDATTWMTEYCAALKSRLVNAGLEIVPARFHIDNETTLFGTSWNMAIVDHACVRTRYPVGHCGSPGLSGTDDARFVARGAGRVRLEELQWYLPHAGTGAQSRRVDLTRVSLTGFHPTLRASNASGVW